MRDGWDDSEEEGVLNYSRVLEVPLVAEDYTRDIWRLLPGGKCGNQVVKPSRTVVVDWQDRLGVVKEVRALSLPSPDLHHLQK